MGNTNFASTESMPEYNYSSFQLDVDGNRSDTSSDKITNGRNSTPDSIEDNNMARQRKWSLFLYSITTVLLFADQNLLAPNLSQAAEEFGFDDDERDKKLGGDIALAFFVLGAPASFLVGCGADSNSISRNFLFGLIVLIGEGACCVTYFTTSYAGLYVTRALTGFSVGGALPLLSSVFGDWYEPHERGKVMASIGIGSGIGISLGQGIAGVFGPMYGWRFPFLVVSIPALCAAILVMTTVVDPARGGSEEVGSDCDEPRSKSDDEEPIRESLGNEEVDKELAQISHRSLSSSPLVATSQDAIEPLELKTYKSEDSEGDSYDNDKSGRCKPFLAVFRPSSYTQHLSTTKELLTSKTVILTLLQGAPGCIPWGIVNTFLNDYLSQDCGMSVHAATATILVFGVGNFVGIVAGGTGGDYLYKKDSRYPSLLSGTMAILGCFPFWVLINTTKVEDGEMTVGIAIRIGITAFLAGLGSGVTGPIVKATLQNTTLPNARGQAFALLNTFDDFGRGLGPVFVASLIIALGGRQKAFNVGVAGWILCGLFNLCIFFTVKADVFKTRQVFIERNSDNSRDDDAQAPCVIPSH
jgi:MFS family permease